MAGHLHFLILDQVPIPEEGRIQTLVRIVDGEAFPLRIEFDGGTAVPETDPAIIIIYFNDLLLVERAAGSFFDQPYLVKTRLWSDNEFSTLMAGFDFDEVMTMAIDVNEELLGGLAYELVIDDSSGITVTLTILNGGVLPPLSGEVIFTLSFTTDVPKKGTFPIDLVPEDCRLDEEPIRNLISGEVEIYDFFVRGDANFSGEVDLADAMFLLGAIFGNGQLSLTCPDSADTNDDGLVDVSDPVYLLNFLFKGTASPPRTKKS